MATHDMHAYWRADGDGTLETAELAGQFLVALGSPLSRAIKRELDQGFAAKILARTIDPSHYTCVDRFWRDYQAVSLLSKFPNFDIGADLDAVAMQKYMAAEAANAETNARLRAFQAGVAVSVDDTRDGVSISHRSPDTLISVIREKISLVLSAFSWDAIFPWATFTSGSSTRLPKSKGDAIYKLLDDERPHVTPDAQHLAVAYALSCPLWAEELRKRYGNDPFGWFKLVAWDELLTVPKNAKTNRVIARQPDMNLMLQKGIGTWIRKRLKKFGVNLDDQRINQDLASIAHMIGLATIDLASASDSVVCELVRLLLPFEWYEAMMLLRTSYGLMPDGSVRRHEKISSMGNGYTFELESLLFWAIGEAVIAVNGGTGKEVNSVYGDDIIIDRKYAGYLVEALSWFGFQTNTEKSFFTGDFFESCGKHYFKGVDVTPYYIRKPILHAQRFIHHLNSIRRWAARPTPGYADGRFYQVWKKGCKVLGMKPSIPDNVGDGALIGTFAEVKPKRRGPEQRWSCGTVLSETDSYRVRGDGVRFYLRQLLQWRVDDTGWSSSLEFQRDSMGVSKYSCSQWDDAPLWCIALEAVSQTDTSLSA